MPLRFTIALMLSLVCLTTSAWAAAQVETITAVPTDGSATILTTTVDGKFAINGIPTFLLGVTYFNVLDNHTSDLDSLAAKGFNLVRILLDWHETGYNETIFNSDGTTISGNVDTVEAFIDYADTKGIVVDVTMLHADIDGQNSASYLTTDTARINAITNGINAFKANGNVLFDIVNEHNYGSFADAHAEANAMLATARAACPACLLTYSSSDNYGTEDEAHVFTTRSGSVVDTTAVRAELAGGINILTPHNDRNPGWNLLTTARAANLRAYLDSIGRQSVPVYFQEDGREGSGGLGSSTAYITVMQDFKAAGGSGYIFHTDAGFDMSVTTFFQNLNDPVEVEVVDNAAAALRTGSGQVRDTALFTEPCTGTVTAQGATWDGGVHRAHKRPTGEQLLPSYQHGN